MRRSPADAGEAKATMLFERSEVVLPLADFEWIVYAIRVSLKRAAFA